MHSGKHLSDEELAQFQSGELSGGGPLHMQSCVECASRLQDLTKATAVFREYLRAVHPKQPMPPRPWQSLSEIVDQHSPAKPTRSFGWIWMTAAAASLLAAFLFAEWKRNDLASARTQHLLNQSFRIARRPEGKISITTGGATVLRPALLETEIDHDPSLERLHRAFDLAKYDWRDPLSARSFLAWRNALAKKRDRVNVIGEGSQRVYRIRTENPAGPLLAASLTLQAAELQPKAGSFEFAGDGTVEMSLIGKIPEVTVDRHPRKTGDTPAETRATPEDTLRVLAALHRIGADVEDPVSVSEDPNGDVVVRGDGVSPERETAIVQSLKGLPHTVVDLSAARSQEKPASPLHSERFVTNMPASIRRKLEKLSGGPLDLQILTDDVLDASASLLARAHAVEVLHEKFRPAVELHLSPEGKRTLEEMRRDHAAKIRRELDLLGAKLDPLLPGSTEAFAPQSSTRAPNFGAVVRQFDTSVNRLLAGSYTEAEGEALLVEIRAQLDILNAAAATREGLLL